MSWQPLLRLSRHDKVRDLVGALPVDRPSVARFVAGAAAADAVEAAESFAAIGVRTTVDWLVASARSAEQADTAATGYLDLLEALRSASVAADITLRPASLGLSLPDPGAKLALENARAICLAATMASATVTVDIKDAVSVDLVEELRREYPDTGAIVHAAAVGAEADVARLADGRVRLVGGLGEAQRERLDIDRVFVRATQVLMERSGRPGLATHDSRLIRIAAELARRSGRLPESYEFVLPYGVRPDEARRLVEAGETVRVSVPFGTDWAAYVAMRIAEHPGNIAGSVGSLARSLVPYRKDHA